MKLLMTTKTIKYLGIFQQKKTLMKGIKGNTYSCTIFRDGMT